ncbi:MAG: signal peptidase II [Pyrinomonadaceae bacterium]|nr:signal peptidase II [Chloracidobacterium sp.]MBP9109248.1 signal peptidase II [Pyrinomonadaceae bacterium]
MSEHGGLLSKLIYFCVSIGLFALDLGTKIWAREILRFGESITIIPRYLSFTYAENTGVAFSQLSGGGETGRWALSAIAAVAAVLVIYFLWRTPASLRLQRIAYNFLLAGILGNLINRAAFGFVIDWIDVQFGAWHYPTFNFADIAICTGAGLLILDLMFVGKTKEPGKTSGSDVRSID